jgi:ornithine decarboxylase
MTALLEISAPALYRSPRPVLSFADARRLAARHGTPLMVISRSAVARNYRLLCENLPGVEFFYAAKANPHRTILSTLNKLGCSVDVCSCGEARQALRAGFAPEAMLHTHPCKTVRNLVDCYALGIRWFIYDSAFELPKLAEHAPDAKLLLRLAMASKSSVINLSAKFGASRHEALPLLRRAAQLGLDVRGLSFHVGSQCLSPDDFRTAFEEAREIWDEAAAAGLNLEVLDIGGGMPAPYREAILSIESYCQSLSQALEASFGDLPIRIIAEPGRCLSAEAATLITSVIGKNVRGGRTWYIIDDGLYGSFSGKVFDHADFALLADSADDRPAMDCIVAGPTCDSTDVVARDQPLPELDVGELLLVPSMGAYTSASASDFNGLELARTVTID